MYQWAGDIKETKWNIYKKGDLIQPKDQLDVLLFKPGFEVLIKDFKNNLKVDY